MTFLESLPRPRTTLCWLVSRKPCSPLAVSPSLLWVCLSRLLTESQQVLQSTPACWPLRKALSPRPSLGFLPARTFLCSIANLDKLLPKHSLKKIICSVGSKPLHMLIGCAKSSEMFYSLLYLKTEHIWQEKKNVVYSFDE